MKLLFSLMSFLVLGGGALAAGTFAVFTDTETTTGSTFTAGTVDISVDGQNPWISTYQVSVGSQTALKPSQTGYITFEVSNVGNNPVHVWKKISSIVDDGGLDGYPCLIAAASVGVSSEPECEEESAFGQVIDDISEVIIYDLSIAPGGTPLPPLIEDSGVPGVLDGTDQSLADRLDVWIYLGVMQPAGTMVVTQSYHLEAASYNEYQGDTSTFNIDMFASQVEGAAIDPCGSPLGIPPALGFELVCPP